MLSEKNELKPVRIKDAETGAFLSVRSLSADVRVDGPFARARLTITFHNDLAKTIEGDLVFPLPPSAALSELTVQVGKRELRGKIRPRQRAQAEYNRAVAAGQTAALGETEGEDLARLRVAPIESGEDVQVTLALVHALVPTDSGHRLVLPLTYMPRYIEDEQALKPTERAAMDRPRPLTVAARATVTVHVRIHGESAPVIRCPSHPTSTRTQRGTTVVTVADVPLDRDLHLEIQDRPKDHEPAPWICHDSSEGPDALGPSTAVAILPPAFADEGPVIPRTITFLVDRSGSMAGPPMQSAIRAVRGALRALGPDDRFNVIAFDNVLEVLARRPVPFTQEFLEAADAFISAIQPRGGTDASMALGAALSDHLSKAEAVAVKKAPAADGAHRLRIIVFMTDGDVAGAEQVLKTEKDKLVDARVHVIGIGDSVNHAMLAALAEHGGGTYMPVATEEDLEKALARLKNAIDAPLWTGIRLVLENDGHRRVPKHQEPPGPLDLFAGEPLFIAFRGPLRPGDRLVVEGQREGGEDRRWILPLAVADLAADTERAGAAGAIWALLKNRRLTYRFDAEDDATLEALGISYGMVNRTVALVGIHTDERGATVEGSVPVALPLPRNIADAEGSVAGPQGFASLRATATGSPPPMGASNYYAAPVAARSSPPRARKVQAMPRPPGAVRAPMPAAFPTPPPPPPRAVMAPAPVMSAMSTDADEETPTARGPAVPKLTDNEAGLRALLLNQGANGLFGAHLGTTLAVVAALVSRGHTTREGLFRAELRRTVATLRKQVASLQGDDRTLAALALALLTMPAGEAVPEALAAPIAATLAGFSLDDPAAARATVRAALAAAPSGWRSAPLAQDIGNAFGLL